MDHQLVEAARNGCEQAQARLYRELFPEVVRHVASRGASREDAEDAAQEAILIAFDRLDHVRCSEAIAAYTKTIARRLLHQRVVADRRRADALTRVLDEAEPSAEVAVMVAADTTKLLAAFRGLPERDRALLRSRVVLEHSTDEVARRFGVTPGSARVLLTRARQRLRANWEGLGVLLGGLLLRWRAGQLRNQVHGMAHATVAVVAIVVTVVRSPVASVTGDADVPSRAAIAAVGLHEPRLAPDGAIVEEPPEAAAAPAETSPSPIVDRDIAGRRAHDREAAPILETPVVSVWEQEPPDDPDVDIHGPDGVAVRVYVDQHVLDEVRIVWDHNAVGTVRERVPSIPPAG